MILPESRMTFPFSKSVDVYDSSWGTCEGIKHNPITRRDTRIIEMLFRETIILLLLWHF